MAWPKDAALKHGHTSGKWTPEYRAWVNMKTRCLNPKADNFMSYGGRGISIAPKWIGSFEAFFSYIGKRPSPIHRLDRRDNSKGYFPGNVRWIVHQENCRNTRQNRIVKWNRKAQCLAAWAIELGINKNTLYDRFRKGWSIEKAFSFGR
jgi:hypothetical protein